jgi:aminoglycoside 6'-N-acetyltransferase I
MRIRPIEPSDAATWERLRSELWPVDAWTHAPEIEDFFAGKASEPEAVLVAEDDVGLIVGFAEFSIRTDIPSLEGRRTGYVEGLYVMPEFRSRGIARWLLVTARNWAREKRCAGFASDRADRLIIDRRFRNSLSEK